MKTKNQRKRTDKVFVDYNDYRDRAFGLKWGTAFAIDELNKVITDNKENDQNVIIELSQMNRKEIDDVLQLAFIKSKKVTIQLNMIDEHGHYYNNLVGNFRGFADLEYLYIDDKPIKWGLVRNISIVDSD
ncbi:MAG: hypothetical protein GX769_02250 [Erysipelothrix sp.]|nr:hypothetical protein [Erysipelothrix sp.]